MVKNILLVGVAAFIGYSLWRKGVKQYYKAQGWDWELKDFQILNLSLTRLRAFVAIELKNTSSVVATVQDIQFDVYTKDVYLGRVSRPEPYTIPANSTKDFDFVADVNLQYTEAIFPALVGALKDLDLPLRFAGSFVVRQGVVTGKIPFEYETTLKELYS